MNIFPKLNRKEKEMDENIIEKLKRILLADPEVKEKWDDLIHITSIDDALKTFKLLYFFVKKLVYVIELVQVSYDSISKDERIALLCNNIEGNFSTSHRQNAFYQFERRVHDLMKTNL